ncbi:hypothetical protein [Maridesulfovibrio zosterae]|uniref:hypothetical protein n=1 Tax=Maridesulfovibrio zosterae TaxID=82171 RepID=UPI000482D76A|nr:hypothetical protein [Maridesulfovibrio zosterae]
MNYFKILLISCFMLIAAQSFAFAGSGKTIIPHWETESEYGGTATGDNIYISNISAHDLIVKVTLYNTDSSILTSGPLYRNFKENNTVIAAGETASVSIVTNIDTMGYGTIEWNNKAGEDDIVGLISTINFQPTNSGKPF